MSRLSVASAAPHSANATAFSALQVRTLVGAVIQAGVSKEQIDSLASRDEMEEGCWVAARRYDELVARAIELTADDAFGLHWGERSTVIAQHAIASLVFHSLKLRDAIAYICRCAPLFSKGNDVSFHETSEHGTLRMEFGPENTPLVARVHGELAMVGLAQLIRHFAGGDGSIDRIHFAHVAPAYRSEYAKFFADKATFEQEFTEIRFDRALLDREQVHASADLRRTAELCFEEQLVQTTQRGFHARKVLEHLVRCPPSELRDMSRAARALGMSERSLRRRLATEGVAFGQLVREAQVLAAQRLLSQKTCTIQEAAFDLGFADPSSFHRAFRKWTGMTPRAFMQGAGNRSTPAR